MSRRTFRFLALAAVLALSPIPGGIPATARAEDAPEEELPNLGGKVRMPTTDEMEALVEQQAPHAEEMLHYTKQCVAGAIAKGPPGCGSFGNAMALVHAAIPECAAYLNLESFRHAEAIFRRDPTRAEKYFVKCLAVSVLLGRRREQTPEIRQAAAYGRLAHAWARLLAGEKIDEPRVVEAAETLRSCAATQPPPPEAWGAFVRAAMRSAGVGGDGALAEWARAERDRLAAASPDDPAWKPGVGDLLADALRLASMEDKRAAAALKAILASPETEAAVAADKSLVGPWNHAVTASRLLKLGLKARYRTEVVLTASGILTFDLPKGCGWATKRVEGNQEDVHLIRERRVTDVAELRVWRYSTSTDYVDDAGKVIGGDNIGARMKKFFDADRDDVTRVKKVGLTIPRLSKGVPDGRGYEVRGEDDTGLELWYREWYFKPAGTQGFVMNVSMRRTGVLLEVDPEIEAILESVREVKSPK